MAASVRRRRMHQDSEPTELATPLLARQGSEELDGLGRSPLPSSRRDESAAILPQEWQDAWMNLISSCAEGWGGLWSCLTQCVSPYLPVALQPFQVSLLQGQRLEELKQRIKVPYDGSLEQHQEALRRLWQAAFPDRECTSLKTPAWKGMGWQGDDPGTDFRGAGFTALQNHLHMAAQQPALFQALLHKEDGERSAWEYPFAVAGVNITFMMIELFELRDEDRLPQRAPGQGFVELLGDSETAFEEVYCIAFQLLDQRWLEMRANYMEFPQVMKRVREQLGSVMSQHYATVGQVRKALLGE